MEGRCNSGDARWLRGCSLVFPLRPPPWIRKLLGKESGAVGGGVFGEQVLALSKFSDAV